MSFTFGQSTTTTSGSTFGTNTLSGGSLIGGGDSKAFQSPGSDNKANFFSSPTTSASTLGCFAFGAKTTAATTAIFSTPTTSSGSSPFGATKPLTFTGFTSPPNQTVGSPGFGQAPNQNAPQNLSFGQPSTPQQAPTFGSPASQATFGGAGNSNFSLTKPPTTSVFAFTRTTGFSLPQQAAATTAQLAQANFSLTSATTSAGGFMQSTPAYSQMFAKSSFSLTPVSSNVTVAAATTTAPTVASATTSGFGFVQQAPNFSLTQPTVTTTAASTFSYSQVSFPSAQPQATPAQTLSFAQPTQATSQPTSTILNMNLPKPSTGPISQIGQASQASVVSQGGQVSQPVLMNQAGKISQIGQVSQAGFQSTGLPGFPTSSTTQAAKISFSVTTSAATSQAAAPTTSALGFSAATSGGLTFTRPSLPTSELPFSKTSVTTTTTATTGIVTAATTSIISLGKSTAAPTMATLTTTTTTTASGLPQPIASITFAQLEENINKWTLELEEQEKIFINQATQINAWDRLLIANGEIILELNDTIQTVKNEQQSLEHELDFVLAQQKELEEVIAPMEKQLLNETGDRMRDPEREHMYSLAENLDTQLRQMSEDLKEVIEHLNETNRSQDTNDPIVQIGRILNAHMSSMQWIDNSIAQISTRLDQLKATHDTLRRDNERSFQLTYN